MNITEFIAKTNFDALKDQKAALLETIGLLEATGNDNSTALSQKLDGILNFIDCFQDMCVDEYGIKENKVFQSNKE